MASTDETENTSSLTEQELLKNEILQALEDSVKEEEAKKIEEDKSESKEKQVVVLQEVALKETDTKSSPEIPHKPLPEPPKSTSPSSPRSSNHPITFDRTESNRMMLRVSHVSNSSNLNIKEGFLWKRGGRVKNWKVSFIFQCNFQTRWFVLKPDGYYYFEVM